MPIWGLWVIGSMAFTAIAGGTIYAVSQPETVVNLPENMTSEQLDIALGSQPKSIGDGLTAAGGAAVVAATIYFLAKKA